MVDLQETPAVPVTPEGGNPRLGYFIAGGLLIGIGWGLAVLANILIHRLAPASGWLIGTVRIFPTLGPYAWLTLGLGLGTGIVGVTLLAIGRATPKGPFLLPGADY